MKIKTLRRSLLKEAEELLYQARINAALRVNELKAIVNQQAELYARQKKLESALESARKDVEHWHDVVASERMSKTNRNLEKTS